MSIAVKVDEDLPVEVADILRRAGHDAQTVTQEGLTGTPDEKLWKVVQQERRCLFTADKGFSNARLFSPGAHAGIVLLRLPRESRAGYIHLTESFLAGMDIESAIGAIVVVTPGTIRLYRGDKGA